MNLTRRTLIRTGLTVVTLPALNLTPARLIGSAAAQPAPARNWRHGLSLFGELKYKPGFAHFDYVNPQAPKGGTIRLTGVGTFDNFNMVTYKGSIAAGVNLLFDSLTTRATDEVSSAYGLIAEAAAYPDDFSYVIYKLRPQAKWHDGKPVTPEDVIYSLDAWKKNYPPLGAYYRHVTKAEKTGDHEVTFTFDAPGNRELPSIVGELTIMPKHWWEGADAKGKKRDIGATTLEPPIGGGAYKLKAFEAGRFVSFERVKDYWAKDLNVNVGRSNFDEVRFEYFRDTTVALEAFKADRLDWRTESSAKNWATAYDFPAAKDKRVVLEEFPVRATGVMQAFVLNNRRDKFKDRRLRRAMNFAFDFETMNKALFYGQYTRVSSYFSGTELASSGLPQGQELEILNTVRDKVPAELFTQPYTNPAGGDPQRVRENLREAVKLLREAGYTVSNQKLVDPNTKQPFTVELLVEQPAFERVMLFYKPSLERLGMTVTVRIVDDAQYQNRLRSWDYDVIIFTWGESLSPGNEQRAYWGSQAADIPGSRNMAGIKDPAVDAMIDRVIYAKSREELVAATHALDRVLLWGFYVVPQWSYGKTRTARWDRFGHAATLPKYGEPDFPDGWWWDADKAAKAGTRK